MKVKIGKYARKSGGRKVKVDISSDDTFSLDHTLAQVIWPALVKFKEERQKMPGVPSMFFEDSDPVDEVGNHTEVAVETAEKRYIDALDRMIWSFKEIAEGCPGEDEFLKKNGKKRKVEKIDGGWRVIETGYDFDKEGHQAYHATIDEGTTLFGKFFRTLWW